MTTWTRRTAPSSINWLRAFTIKKESSNFYRSFSGILKANVPTKETSNFYRLAGVIDGSGSYLLGKTVDNFVRSEAR